MMSNATKGDSMTKEEIIERGYTEEDSNLLCPYCGSSVLRVSAGLIDFHCLGFYDTSSKSFHEGGESCRTIKFLRDKCNTLQNQLDENPVRLILYGREIEDEIIEMNSSSVIMLENCVKKGYKYARL